MSNGFEQVQKEQERLAALEQKAAELVARDAALSKQIAECHATGTGEVAKLTAQRRDLREQLEDVRDALPLLRDRITKDREAAGKAAAEARMTGLSRAFGSVKQELDDDEAKLGEAAAAYKAAAARVNARFKTLAILRAEAGALSDRFGVAGPALSPVVLPVRRERCVAASRLVQSVGFLDTGYRSPSTEQNEFGARRRDYAEIKGSPAYEIIQQAGLKLFPPPTSAQLADRERRQAAARDGAQIVEAARPLVELNRVTKCGG